MVNLKMWIIFQVCGLSDARCYTLCNNSWVVWYSCIQRKQKILISEERTARLSTCSGEKEVLTREAEWLAQPGRLNGDCLVCMDQWDQLWKNKNIHTSCLSELITLGNRKANGLGTTHSCPCPVLWTTSSLLNSLEDQEQLGSALSEAKTHGGYLKCLFYCYLRGCSKACHGLPGPAPTFSCHSPLASIYRHIFSLQNFVSKNILSLMRVFLFLICFK